MIQVVDDFQLFMDFSNPYMPLELFGQVISGLAVQLCVDTTFKFNLCKKIFNMLTMGLSERTCVYHPTDSFISPEDGDSFIFYSNALDGSWRLQSMLQ